MKYIKAYENFFKKIGNVLSDLLNPPSYSRIIDADFNKNEEKLLKELNFIEDKKNTFIFSSPSSNLKIRIEKYWDEEVPGTATKYFIVTINDKQKRENNFDKLISEIKKLIPEIDLTSGKYNL